MQQNIELRDPQPVRDERAVSFGAEPSDWWKLKLDAANIRCGIGLQGYLTEEAQKRR